MNILITGASRGIGAASYSCLKLAGQRVAGHSSKGGGELIAAELTDPDAPAALWEEALERLGGRIDVLVNNAGVFEAISDDSSAEDWHRAWNRTLTINLQAAADLCRLAVRHFLEPEGDGPRGGRIINVASRAAYRGDSPQHWHYAASKAGMVAMTKSIARGYAGDGILAFSVAPGFTASEMTEDYLSGRGGSKILSDIPLGRVATPQEVAEVIRWLACDAPASVTGSVIDVNGASFVR